MLENIAVLVITGVALFAADLTRLRRADRREKWILALFFVPILYLSLMYATNSDWVNLHDLANGTVGRIAKIIVDWLEHP
jgi:hypothetical protein